MEFNLRKFSSPRFTPFRVEPTQLLKSKSISFVPFSRSTLYNEMPNKYSDKRVPKIPVEKVIESNKFHMFYGNDDLDDNVDILSMSHGKEFSDKMSPTASKFMEKEVERPFYYTENNELQTMTDFFQVYKQLKSQQRKQEKVYFQRLIETGQQKINEARAAIIPSSFSKRQSPTPSMYAITTPSSLVGSLAGSRRGSQAGSRNGSVLPHDNKNSEMKSEYFTDDKSGVKKTPSHRKSKSDLPFQNYMEQIKNSNQQVKTKLPVHTVPVPIDLKYTHREILKQLRKHNINPRRLLQSSAEFKREKSISSVFNTPKVLDQKVETGLRKQEMFSRRGSHLSMPDSDIFKDTPISNRDYMRPMSPFQDLLAYNNSQNAGFDTNKPYSAKTEIDGGVTEDQLENVVIPLLLAKFAKVNNTAQEKEAKISQPIEMVAEKINQNVNEIDKLLRVNIMSPQSGKSSPDFTKSARIHDGFASKGKLVRMPSRGKVQKKFAFKTKLENNRMIQRDNMNKARFFKNEQNVANQMLKNKRYIDYYL